VAVIMAGRPLTFEHVASEAGAVLYMWHPGTMGGPAIANLLTGQTSPSGRLPVTFPRTVGQVPIYYEHLNTGRPPLESELGIPLGNPAKPEGYTSKYIDVDFTPAYPFGFGLTYTRFTYSNLHVSAPVLEAGRQITVSAEIANRGERSATETVQFYIRDLSASVAQPVRKLRGFERIALRSGESRTVNFRISPSDLTFYDQHGRLVTEPGRFFVWIAPDSVSGLRGEFELR
jgi:beta-glucosidase